MINAYRSNINNTQLDYQCSINLKRNYTLRLRNINDLNVTVVPQSRHQVLSAEFSSVLTFQRQSLVWFNSPTHYYYTSAQVFNQAIISAKLPSLSNWLDLSQLVFQRIVLSSLFDELQH